MNQKINQGYYSVCPLKRIAAWSFLAALPVSSCAVKQRYTYCKPLVHASLTDLQPITEGLKQFEEQKEQSIENSHVARLQNDFINAIKVGHWETVKALLKESSIDPSNGGVFISQESLAKASSMLAEERISVTKVPGIKKEDIMMQGQLTAPKKDWCFVHANNPAIRVSSLVLAAKCKDPAALNRQAIFLSLLETNGIDITTPDPASHFSLLNLVIKNKWATQAKYLIEKLDQKDLLAQYYDDRTTPLHSAIKLKLGDALINLLVERLPQSALSSSARDEQGDTPLHLAIKFGSGRVVASLVNKMAVEDLSIRSSNGKKPLYLAIEQGRLSCVKSLLRKLPSKEVADGLMFAFQSNNNKELLKQYRQYIDPMRMFKDKNRLIVNALLTKGRLIPDDLSIQDPEGQTLLHLAIKFRDIDAVKLLLNKFSLSSLSFKDTQDQTLLHLAVKSGLKDVIAFLVDNLPSELLLARDSKGRTPLALAIEEKKQHEFDILANSIMIHLGQSALLREMFSINQNGYSLFSSAFLRKKEQQSTSFLSKSTQTCMPAMLFESYRMFKHVMYMLSNYLTADQFASIIQAIDAIEAEGKISRLYGRSLRSVVGSYVKAKGICAELPVTTSNFTSTPKKGIVAKYNLGQENDVIYQSKDLNTSTLEVSDREEGYCSNTSTPVSSSSLDLSSLSASSSAYADEQKHTKSAKRIRFIEEEPTVYEYEKISAEDYPCLMRGQSSAVVSLDKNESLDSSDTSQIAKLDTQEDADLCLQKQASSEPTASREVENNAASDLMAAIRKGVRLKSTPTKQKQDVELAKKLADRARAMSSEDNQDDAEDDSDWSE